MSVQSYLESLASKLVLSTDEKLKIGTSINYLSRNINSYFGESVNNHFIFGSYTRETILPRVADEKSDIDYMVVFKNDKNYKPQTLLNHLKKFAEH